MFVKQTARTYADWQGYIDAVVGWAAATKGAVRVAITLRNNIGTASPHGAGMKTSDVPCAADYVSNSTARARWLDTWRFLAKRYRGSVGIAWLEPASEPHLLRAQPDPSVPGGKPWVPCYAAPEVTALFNSVVLAIRESDPDVPVAAAPTGYEACPGLDLVADKLDDTNVVYALNWPCNLGGGDVGYEETATCRDVGKLNKGVPTPPRACVPGCSKGEPDGSGFRYDRSTVEALAAPALAFRDAHRVPLWVDQLMCPPAGFHGASPWLTDSIEVLGLKNRTSFSWWTWKAPFGGNATQAVLWTPSAADRKDDPTLYQLYHPGFELYRQAFAPSSRSSKIYTSPHESWAT